jgi:hypothetical protein
MVLAAVLAMPGAAAASFSGDNGRIAFTHNTNCVTSCHQDVVTVKPDGSAAVVVGPGTHPAWSPDGSRLAFTDGSKIYISDPDGSNLTTALDWGPGVEGIAWSPDGTKLAAALRNCADDECRPDIYTMNLDGTNLIDLTPDLLPDRDPAWSPDGTKIAYGTVRFSNLEIFVMAADGSGQTNLTNDPSADRDPSWSPDGGKIAFDRSTGSVNQILVMNADGSGQQSIPAGDDSHAPSWSPDGSAIAYSRGSANATIHVYLIASGTDTAITTYSSSRDETPDWGPLYPAPPPPPPDTGGYPRPRGATPFRTNFVPAYEPCEAPNTTHGTPLAFGSCAPPAQASDQLTLGTPEANGAPARGVGYLLLRSLRGNPSNTWDDADVEVIFDTADVRNGGSLTDYGGELSLESTVRITDHGSPPDTPDESDPNTGTVEDIPVKMTVPCFTTPSDAGRGSSCHLDTTIDGVLGNAIVESARTIWELGQVQVRDGGPDGIADTEPNGLFEVQGVFVP